LTLAEGNFENKNVCWWWWGRGIFYNCKHAFRGGQAPYGPTVGSLL